MMNRNSQDEDADSYQKIAGLVRTLCETEEELQKLTGGQVDTVMYPDGQSYLLHDAQERLRRSETIQRESAEKQIAILNALPPHIALIDRDGVITSVNKAWKQFATANALQGPDFFVGQNYVETCDFATGDCSEESHAIAAGIRRVLEGKIKDFTLEYPCHSPAEQRWFLLKVTPIHQDRMDGAVVMHINITERKLAELRLYRLNRLHTVLGKISETIVRTHARRRLYEAVCHIMVEDGNLRMVFIAEMDEEARVARPAAFHGEGFEHLTDATGVIPLDGPSSMDTVATALLTGKHDFCNNITETPRFRPWHEANRKNGLLSVASFPFTLRGAVIGVLVLHAGETDFFGKDEMRVMDAIASDISFALESLEIEQEARSAEESLRESEEQFRSIFAATATGIAISTPLGRYLRANDAYCRMLGYSEEELLERDFASLTHPDDLNVNLKLRDELLTGERESFVMEKRYLKKTGEIVWTRHSVSATHEADGDIATLVVVAEDITSRKQAEDALKALSQKTEQRERMLTTTLSALIDFAYIFDKEGRFLFANEPLLKLWGIPLEDAVGKNFPELGYPDDLARQLQREVQEVFDTGKSITNETPFTSPTGHHGYYEYIFSPALAADGTVDFVVGSTRDVTERRHSEEKLRQSEALLVMAGRLGRIGAWALDLTSHQLIWSEEVYAIHEAHPGYAPDVESGIDFYAPGDRDTIRNAMNACIQDGESFDLELQIITMKGRRVWTRSMGEAVKDATGAIKRIQGAFQDISDRKAGEEELARTNRSLQMLSACNEKLIRAKHEQDLLDEICRIAVEIGGYRMAWVGYAQNDDFRTIAPMAYAGLENGYLSEIKLSWSEDELSGQGPGGNTIRGGQPVLCEDIENDPSFSHWIELVRQRGYRSMVCLPLREGSRTFGLLALYGAHVQKLGADEIRLLQELADDLSFGLVHIRTNAHVQDQAALLDAASDAIILKDMEDNILYWSKGAERIYGWAAKEVIGKKTRKLLSPEPEKFDEAMRLVMQEGHWEGEMQKHIKGGDFRTIEVRWTIVRDDNGNPKSVLAINTDITERKKIEAQFFRVQRMESIGTLASGIAHDLNNALAPILMAVEILDEKITDKPTKELLATMQASAQHGADLVKQVLSFARGVEGERVVVNVVHLLHDIQSMIRDTFPKNISFSLAPSQGLWTVTADPTQLHQVFTNLCVNARDAMPDGGTMRVSMENIVLDDVYAGMNPGSKPGSYVQVTVEDTGQGIPPAIRDKIFEPFFTTKEIGKGTGLGLSTTISIIKSHGGFMNLYSEIGKGTIFKVYLPAETTAEASENTAIAQTRLPRGNGEMVLVVDDDTSIRSVAQKTLERYGYHTLLAGNGAEAVALYARHMEEVDIVLTDMNMPVMDGAATILALRALNPRVKIVASSGLEPNAGVSKAVGAGVRHFVPKPYTADALLKILAEALLELDQHTRSS